MLHPTMPILLKVKRQGFVNSIASFYRQSRVQAFFVLTMGIFLALVLFSFFYHGFRYIQRFEDLQDILVRYIFSIFFFAIFLMLAFSGTIITYSVLYRSREAAYLLAMPVPYSTLFFISFVDSVVFSSWAFLFLAVPVLCAYGLRFHLDFWFYPVSLLALFPFLLIPAAIGGILVLLVGLLPARRRKAVIIIMVTLVIIPLIYVGARVFLAEKRFDVMQALWVEEVFRSLNFSRNPFLPSLWAAEIVTSFAAKAWPALALNFLALVSNALFLGMLAHFIAAGLFYRGWNVVHGMGGGRSYRGLTFVERLVSGIPLLGRKVKLILVKDIKTFFRDPAQWLQFTLLFGFIGLYFLNLRSFAYDETALRWKSIISFLNLGAVSMTLATLNSRFVFPQISLEGRKFWVIGLMPVTKREIIFGKFCFAFVSGWVISSLLILLSDFMLKISWNIRFVHLYTIFLTAFGLAGISVGSGAIWPNFRETVPSKIVSGLGGTLNLIISVFFVIVITFIEAIPCHYFYIRFAGQLFPNIGTGVFILGSAAFFAIGSALLFLYVGSRRFDKVEVF